MLKKFSLLLFIVISILSTPPSLKGQNQMSYGPLYGGMGGNAFSDQPDIDYRIRSIRILSGLYINSIQVIYDTPRGIVTKPPHGGNGGREFVFLLNPGEYIRGISIRSGRFVDAIKFHTNFKQSIFYGGSGGSSYQDLFVPEKYQIIGFHGRSGSLLDAIGIIWAPH